MVLNAARGVVPAAPEADAALHRGFDPRLSDEEHLAAVRAAFFAPGNDPAEAIARTILAWLEPSTNP